MVTQGWVSDPYLYYKSIKDTPVCGHLDFNCLKLKYEVLTGLENSTRPLVFTSVSGCRASEYFDISIEN